jgi:predicted nucleic acid-binding protein
MIVVDTNIISYFYLNSERSAMAEQAFQKDPWWVAS